MTPCLSKTGNPIPFIWIIHIGVYVPTRVLIKLLFSLWLMRSVLGSMHQWRIGIDLPESNSTHNMFRLACPKLSHATMIVHVVSLSPCYPQP